jgi:hypothetical protein
MVVTSVRKRFCKAGFEAALYRKKPEREYERCLDGEVEAHLIAQVCGDPPQGKDRWTLRLLQKHMVQLSYAETVSHETVRTRLKKMNLSLG